MPGVSLRVPEGLRDLMKVFAKEVLRQRPLDIYKFSSQYFESMLQEEKDFEFQGYEVMSPYETIFKTGTRREQNHVPLALVCAIIPEELTELIKEFIKAVLRANPNNICKFAVVYFRSLRDQRHKTCSVQYKSYENYLQSTQCVKLAPYFRCTCGRVIGDGLTRATTNNGHSAEYGVTGTETNPSSTVNDLVTGNTNSVESSINDEKYINAVYILQRFFRRSLRRLHTNAQSSFSTKNRKDFQMTAETAAFVVQGTLRKFIKTEAEKFATHYPSEENSDIVSSLVLKSDANAKITGTETTGNRNKPIPKQYDIGNAPYLDSDKNQSAVSKTLTPSKDWRSQQEHTSNRTFSEEEPIYETLSLLDSNNAPQVESLSGAIKNPEKRISGTVEYPSNISEDITRNLPVALLESTGTHPASHISTENTDIIAQRSRPHLELEGAALARIRALHDLSAPAATYIISDDKKDSTPVTNFKTQTDSLRNALQTTNNGTSLETEEEYTKLSEDSKNIRSKRAVAKSMTYERPFSIECAVIPPESDYSHSESTQSADQVLVENASITDQVPTPHLEMDVSTPLTNEVLLQNVQKLDATNAPHELYGPVTSNLVFGDKEKVTAFSNIETQAESPLGVKQNIRNRISETEPEYQNLSDDISGKQTVAEDISSEKPPSIESAVNSSELESSHSQSTQSADQVLLEHVNITDQVPTPHLEMDVSTPLTNEGLLQNVQKLDDTNSPHDLSGPVTSNIAFDDKENVGAFSNIETQAESPLGAKQNIRNRISETEPEYQNLSDDISRKQTVAEDISSEKPPSIKSAVNSSELESSHSQSTQSADQVLLENANITDQVPTPHLEMDVSTPLANKALLQNVQKLDDTNSPHELSGPLTSNIAFDDKENVGAFTNIETQAESPLGAKQNIRNRISETEPEYQNLSDDISRKQTVAEDISSEKPPSIESAVNSSDLESSHSQSTQSADQVLLENTNITDQVPTPHLEMDESTPLANKALLQNVQKLDDTNSPHELSGPLTSNIAFDDKENVGAFTNIETQAESPLGVKQNIRNRISETEPEYQNLSDDISRKQTVAEDISSEKPPSIKSAVNSSELESSHSQSTQSADQVLLENTNITDQVPTPHLEMDESTPLANKALLQNVQKLDDTNSPHELYGPVTSNIAFDDKENVGAFSNIETQAESPLGAKQNIRNRISETEPEYQNLSDDISRKQTVAEDISSEKPPSIKSAVNSSELESSHSQSTQSADQVLLENANITDQVPTPHLEMDESTPLANKALLQNVQKLDDTNSPHELSGPLTSNISFDDKENVGAFSNIETQAESPLGAKQNIRNRISETEPEYQNLSDDISRKQTVAEDISSEKPPSIESAVNSSDLESSHSQSTQSADQVLLENTNITDQVPTPHLEMDESTPLTNEALLQNVQKLDDTKSPHDLSGPVTSNLVFDDKEKVTAFSNIETQAESPLGAKRNIRDRISETEREYPNLSDDISRKQTVAEDISSEKPPSIESAVNSSDLESSHSQSTQSADQVLLENTNITDQVPTPHLEMDESTPLTNEALLQNVQKLDDTKSPHDLSGPVTSNLVFDDKEKVTAFPNIETQAESPRGVKQNIRNRISETEPEFQNLSDDISRKQTVAEDISSEKPPSIESAVNSSELESSHSQSTQSADQVLLENANITDQVPTPQLEMDVSTPLTNEALLQNVQKLDDTKSPHDLSGPVTSNLVFDDKEKVTVSSNIETQAESPLGAKRNIRDRISETEREYPNLCDDISRKQTVAEDISSEKPPSIKSAVNSSELESSHSQSTQSAGQVLLEHVNITDQVPTPQLEMDVSTPLTNEALLQNVQKMDDTNAPHELYGPVTSNFAFDGKKKVTALSNIETQSESPLGTKQNIRDRISETEREYPNLSDDISRKLTVTKDITTETLSSLKLPGTNPRSNSVTARRSESTESEAEEAKRHDQRDIPHLELDVSKPSINTVQLQEGSDLYGKKSSPNLSIPAKSQFVSEDKKESTVVSNTEAETSPDTNQNTHNETSKTKTEYELLCEETSTKPAVTEVMTTKKRFFHDSTVPSSESDNIAISHSESTQSIDASIVDQSPIPNLELGVSSARLDEINFFQDLSRPAASHFMFDDKNKSGHVLKILPDMKQNNKVSETEKEYQSFSEEKLTKPTVAEDNTSERPSLTKMSPSSAGTDSQTASSSAPTESAAEFEVGYPNIIHHSTTPHLQLDVSTPSINAIQLQESTNLNETLSLQSLSGPNANDFISGGKTECAAASNIEMQAESLLGKTQSIRKVISETKAQYSSLEKEERPSSVESTITSPESDPKAVSQLEDMKSTDQNSGRDAKLIDESLTSHLELDVSAPTLNQGQLQEGIELDRKNSEQDLSGPAATHFVLGINNELPLVSYTETLADSVHVTFPNPDHGTLSEAKLNYAKVSDESENVCEERVAIESLTSERPVSIESTLKSGSTTVSHSEPIQSTDRFPVYENKVNQSPTTNLGLDISAPSINTEGYTDLNETLSLQDLSGPTAMHFISDDKEISVAVSNIETQRKGSLGTKRPTQLTSETETEYQKHSDEESREPRVSDDMPFERPSLLKAKGENESDNSTNSHSDSNIIGQTPTPILKLDVSAPSLNKTQLQHGTDLDETKSLQDLDELTAAHFVSNDKEASKAISNIETESLLIRKQYIQNKTAETKTEYLKHAEEESPATEDLINENPALVESKVSSPETDYKTATHLGCIESASQILVQDERRLDQNPSSRSEHNETVPSVSEDIHLIMDPAAMLEKPKSLCGSESIMFLQNETNRNESMEPSSVANRTSQIEVPSTDKATNNFEQITKGVLVSDVQQLQNKTIDDGLTNTQKFINPKNKVDSKNNLANHKIHESPTTYSSPVAESSITKSTHSTSSIRPDGLTEKDVIDKVSAATDISTTEPSSTSGNALTNRSTRIGTQNSHENHSGTSNSNKVDNTLSKPIKQPKQPSREYCIGIPLEAPIAELQLKSFKTSDTAPPWYASIVEDSSTGHNETESRRVTKPKAAISIELITKSDGLINYDGNEVSSSNSLGETAFERDSRELNNNRVDGSTDESKDTISTSTEDPQNERMPTYLYGIHTPRQTPIQSRKVYKKPTAFTVPFGSTDIPDVELEKCEEKGYAEVECSNNEPEQGHADSVKDISNNNLNIAYLELNQVQTQLDVQSPKPLSDQIGESDLRQTENKEIGNLSSSKETNIGEDPGDVEHRTDINIEDETIEPMLDTIVELNEGSSKIELYDYAELDSKSDSRWSMLKAMDENTSNEYMNKNPNFEDNHASPGSLNEGETTADRNNDVNIDSIPVETQNCKEKSTVQIHNSDRTNTKEAYLSTTTDAQIEEAAASTIQRAFRKYIASRTNTDELKTSTNSSWNSSQTTQIFIENDAEDSPAFSYPEIDNDKFDNSSTFQISGIKAEQDQEKNQNIEDKKIDWFVGSELIQTSKVMSLNNENKSPTNDLPIKEFPESVESKPSGPFPVNHLEINTFEKNLDPEMSLEHRATQSAIDGMQLQAFDEYRKAFAPHASQHYNEELGSMRKKSQSAGNEGGTPVANNEFLFDSDRTNMAEIMATFLACERAHTLNTNKSSNNLRQTPVNNEMSFMKDFVSSPIHFTETDVPYEQLEEHCVKRSISLTYLVKDEDRVVDVKVGASHDYASDKTGNKLQESDEPSKYAHGFENNAVTSPDLEDDKVIVNRLQREDTRENSAQSDCVVFGESYENQTPEQPEKANAVIYEDAVKFIERPEFTSNSSLCLDDDTSENIRKQMMAYSLSDADSDTAGASMSEMEANNVIVSRLDSNIRSALADATGTSTETESTIVSAANISRADTNSNETINASLENLIKMEAVRKIEKAYRKYQQKTQRSKIRAHLRSSEPTMNSESSLAAKRMTLQRGNALRNDSALDEEHLASSKGRGRTKLHANDQEHDAPLTDESNPKKVIVARNAAKLAAEVTSDRTKKILDNKLKWLAMRQNSMPVQIDSEVFRVIPKHMRKRIKSAEGEKKARRRILKD